MSTLVEQIRAAIDEAERAVDAYDSYGSHAELSTGLVSPYRDVEIGRLHLAGHRAILDAHPIAGHVWSAEMAKTLRLGGSTHVYACETCDTDSEHGTDYHAEPGCPTVLALARIYRIELPQ